MKNIPKRILKCAQLHNYIKKMKSLNIHVGLVSIDFFLSYFLYRIFIFTRGFKGILYIIRVFCPRAGPA